MSTRRLLASLLALTLFGCQSESTDWVLGECIQEQDGFATCDAYCGATFGTLAMDLTDAESEVGPVEGHACELHRGVSEERPRPFVSTWGAYQTVAECEAEASVFMSGSIADQDPFLLALAFPDIAVRCCCRLD